MSEKMPLIVLLQPMDCQRVGSLHDYGVWGGEVKVFIKGAGLRTTPPHHPTPNLKDTQKKRKDRNLIVDHFDFVCFGTHNGALS